MKNLIFAGLFQENVFNEIDAHIKTAFTARDVRELQN